MKLSYELTKEDYLAFNLYYIKNSAAITKSLFAQRFFPPIAFLVLPFIFTGITGEFLVGLSVVFMLTAVAWMMFYPRYFYWHVKNGVNKALNEGKNENLIGEHTFTLHEDGFIEKNKVEERKVSWSGIEKVAENEEYYFLFFSSMSAYILPKRAFADEEAKRQFRQLADRAVSSDRLWTGRG
ncbi:YcxB family protein [Pseudobacillus badius]|uniref:YcxB family protein n=1 Tax=Bacillus badius TaxID=1455 RepID=UPI0007B33FF6|nr:YcxB family protein [Bacillus badius]KZR58940.1 hypothetical protein A3781_15495 [Bacillus badius]